MIQRIFNNFLFGRTKGYVVGVGIPASKEHLNKHNIEYREILTEDLHNLDIFKNQLDYHITTERSEEGSGKEVREEERIDGQVYFNRYERGFYNNQGQLYLDKNKLFLVDKLLLCTDFIFGTCNFMGAGYMYRFSDDIDYANTSIITDSCYILRDETVEKGKKYLNEILPDVSINEFYNGIRLSSEYSHQLYPDISYVDITSEKHIRTNIDRYLLRGS